jgi:hypothetical protein
LAQRIAGFSIVIGERVVANSEFLIDGERLGIGGAVHHKSTEELTSTITTIHPRRMVPSAFGIGLRDKLGVFHAFPAIVQDGGEVIIRFGAKIDLFPRVATGRCLWQLGRIILAEPEGVTTPALRCGRVKDRITAEAVRTASLCEGNGHCNQYQNQRQQDFFHVHRHIKVVSENLDTSAPAKHQQTYFQNGQK